MFVEKPVTSFATKLFLCIFSTAFLLLLAGLLILYRFAVNATWDINDQMMRESLSITTQNLETTVEECNRVARLSLAQPRILNQMKQPFSYPSESYSSNRKPPKRNRISGSLSETPKSVPDEALQTAGNWESRSPGGTDPAYAAPTRR